MINEKQAKRFCKEDISKIKNCDLAIADKTQTWDCHHMTETWWHCSKKELIENECYYHRKACELIFLTHAEHIRLHNTGKSYMRGKHLSDETKKKLSESMKGKNLGKVLSDEARKKMSESRKGKEPWNKGLRNIYSEETRRKISEARKGRTSNRKGVTLSEETRKKMSEAQKRRYAMKKNLKKDIT